MYLALDKSSLPRVNILGVGVHAIDMAKAINLVDSAVSQGVKGYALGCEGIHPLLLRWSRRRSRSTQG